MGRENSLPYFLFAQGNEFSRPIIRWRLTRRATVRAAAAVICVSDFIRSPVLRDGARPDRTVTVAPGFDVTEVDAFRRRDRPGRFAPVEAAFPPGVPTVLSVCRLAATKGVDRMIAALPGILARAPGTRYVIVGAGPDGARLRRLAAESPAAGSIVFLGARTGDEKFVCYDRCTVFAMPSSREAFGLVFLEAGAFGKPVVGGRTVPATDAVLEDRTGYLVDPEDTHAVADAVAGLLNDPAKATRLGANGRRRVEQELTWRASARRIRDLIHGHLGRASRAAGPCP